jgi:hypothetical protein
LVVGSNPTGPKPPIDTGESRAPRDRYEPLPLVFNSVIYHAYHSKGKLSLRMFSAIGRNLGERPPPEVTAFKAKIVIF